MAKQPRPKKKIKKGGYYPKVELIFVDLKQSIEDFNVDFEEQMQVFEEGFKILAIGEVKTINLDRESYFVLPVMFEERKN